MFCERYSTRQVLNTIPTITFNNRTEVELTDFYYLATYHQQEGDMSKLPLGEFAGRPVHCLVEPRLSLDWINVEMYQHINWPP